MVYSLKNNNYEHNKKFHTIQKRSYCAASYSVKIPTDESATHATGDPWFVHKWDGLKHPVKMIEPAYEEFCKSSSEVDSQCPCMFPP